MLDVILPADVTDVAKNSRLAHFFIEGRPSRIRYTCPCDSMCDRGDVGCFASRRVKSHHALSGFTDEEVSQSSRLDVMLLIPLSPAMATRFVRVAASCWCWWSTTLPQRSPNAKAHPVHALMMASSKCQ
jgi:hypothetical protein